MKSQPVALLGEAPPRVLVAPKGTRANSWEDVADLSARAGIVLDRWQEVILEAAMGERSDRTWAAKRVGVTVPRQNGKSQLLVSRALAGALLFGEKKIVISAHLQDTARESFSKLMEIIEDDANGWIRDRIRPNGIMQALNREAVRFLNGATIQFKARTGSGSKGFSSDCLMLDEAQILGQRAWVSINSTMSAMPNPQVWLLGTAPQEEDDSEVFESVRDAAIVGKTVAAAWCEWGADPDSPDFDPASEYTRWTANPAWNTRINHDVVDGEYETYPAERFGQDRLGLWRKAGANLVLPAWADRFVDADPPTPTAIGISVSLDAMYGSIASADLWDDGRVNLSAVERRQGTDWLVAEALRIQTDYGCMVAIDEKCPDGTLIQKLTDAGVFLDQLDLAMLVSGCSELVNRTRQGTVTHQKTTDLDAAVTAAQWRDVGDGRRVFGRKRSSGPIDMLEAATAAMWAALNSQRMPSIY